MNLVDLSIQRFYSNTLVKMHSGSDSDFGKQTVEVHNTHDNATDRVNDLSFGSLSSGSGHRTDSDFGEESKDSMSCSFTHDNASDSSASSTDTNSSPSPQLRIDWSRLYELYHNESDFSHRTDSDFGEESKDSMSCSFTHDNASDSSASSTDTNSSPSPQLRIDWSRLYELYHNESNFSQDRILHWIFDGMGHSDSDDSDSEAYFTAPECLSEEEYPNLSALD